MLDIKYIRENRAKVKENLLNRKGNPSKGDVDKLLELDEKKSSILAEINSINEKRNSISKKLQDEALRTKELVEEGKQLKENEQELREQLTKLEKEIQEILFWIPNVLNDSVNVGKDEYANKEIFIWTPNDGEINELGIGFEAEKFMPRELPFLSDVSKAKHHKDILENLKLADFEQGAHIAGTRFTYIMGDLVKLQFAIQNLLLSHLYQKGFTPIVPPLLVKEKVLYGTSHFPEGLDQAYEIRDDYLESKERLFLVGSSEPSNFALFMDKTIDAEILPQKVVAITPCFRSEVGSWGKDVKGLKRVHQFDKLEMDVVCLPEQSMDIYKELLEVNKWLLQTLKLPFHIVQKCSGDSGYYASHIQADPEVWLVGQKTFMEVGTDTNATDYQARRMNIKFKRSNGEKGYCHTVNDTGVAMGRILLAITEHYQTDEGFIRVPEALKDLIGKEIIDGR